MQSIEFLVSDLRPHERNYRKHPPEQLTVLARSLQRFGQLKPIRAMRDADGKGGTILAGHGVWEAAKTAGWTSINVWWYEGSNPEHLLVADNEISRLADVDQEQLLALLRELSAAGELDVTGWNDAALAELLASVEKNRVLPGDEDEAPPIEREVHSRLGVLYELGPHRLVCGDSTDAAIWDLLFDDGEKIDLVWSDPPYGVAYVGGTSEKLTIQNDNLDENALETLLRRSLGHMFARLRDNGQAYIASPSGPLFLCFARVLREHRWCADMQWIKDSLVLGRSDFHLRHEAIFWCGREADLPVKREFEVPKPRRNGEHPTMKPLELIVPCLAQSGVAGAVTCDAFGGSGSTLIASAMVQMRARLIELDPRYADVIRRRWTRWARTQGIDPGPGALEDEAK